MPQEFHVLQCYHCQFFQVHIVKRTNNWQCKMCGEKQSILKVFAEGSGKECRLIVQGLNSKGSQNQEQQQQQQTLLNGENSNVSHITSNIPIAEIQQCNGTVTLHNSKQLRSNCVGMKEDMEEAKNDDVSSKTPFTQQHTEDKTNIFDEDFDLKDIQF